jgi:hypothetical protein
MSENQPRVNVVGIENESAANQRELNKQNPGEPNDNKPERGPSETTRFWRLNTIAALNMMDKDERQAQDPELLGAFKSNKAELEQLQAKENAVLTRYARFLDSEKNPEKQPIQENNATQKDHINMLEVLERAANQRERDAQNLAKANSHKPEKNPKAEIESEGLGDGAGIFVDTKTTDEAEKTQRALIEQVQKQFHVNGAKYHFKDKPDKVAFIDQGKRMTTSYNDERIATSLVMLAEAKGWKSIKVKGHPDFRREVWLAASIQGLGVRGYKPTEQDLNNLDQYRQRTMQNSVEKGETSRTQDGINKQYYKTATTAKTPDKASTGRLLEHGEAKYKHNPNEKQSYYVKLDTDAGEKIIWGIDLKRVLSESKAQIGETVSIQNRGSKNVQVASLKRDEAGNVIGKELIDTKRNTWELSRTNKEKVVQAVAAAVISSRTKNPEQAAILQAAINKRLSERKNIGKVPTVPIYDNKAANRINPHERTREPHAQERAQEQAR